MTTMTRIRTLALAAALSVTLATGVRADEVLLRSGGQLDGDVVSRSAEAIVVEVDGGQITVGRADILQIVPGPTALAEARERAFRLAPEDVQGWLDFALWARDHDLQGPTRRALRRVLTLDPGNPLANEAAGNIRVGQQWMTPNAAYRAMGYVEFEGHWVQPEERDRVLQERAVQAEIERAQAERLEAQARAREAEARAQQEVARAQRAAADMAEQLQAALSELNRRQRFCERPPHSDRPCAVHGDCRR
jgi:hypothetical protein